MKQKVDALLLQIPIYYYCDPVMTHESTVHSSINFILILGKLHNNRVVFRNENPKGCRAKLCNKVF